MDDEELDSLGIYLRPSRGNYLMQRFMKDLVLEPSNSPLMHFPSETKTNQRMSSNKSSSKKRRSDQVTLDEILSATAAEAIKKQKLKGDSATKVLSKRNPKVVKKSDVNDHRPSKEQQLPQSDPHSGTENDRLRKIASNKINGSAMQNSSTKPQNRSPVTHCSVRKFAILNNSLSDAQAVLVRPQASVDVEKQAGFDVSVDHDTSHPTMNKVSIANELSNATGNPKEKNSLRIVDVSTMPDAGALGTPIVSDRAQGMERKHGILESTRISFLAQDPSYSQSLLDRNPPTHKSGKASFVKPKVIKEEYSFNDSIMEELTVTDQGDANVSIDATGNKYREAKERGFEMNSERIIVAKKPFKLKRDPACVPDFLMLQTSKQPSKATSSILEKYFPIKETAVPKRDDPYSETAEEPLGGGEEYGLPKLLVPGNSNKKLEVLCDYVRSWNKVRKLNSCR